MRTVKATGKRVIVVPVECKTDGDGNAISDGGIYLGRTMEQPLGIVTSVGSEVEGIEPGDRVIWARDKGASFTFEGVNLNSLTTQTCCPHCKRRIKDDQIMAVLPKNTQIDDNNA